MAEVTVLPECARYSLRDDAEMLGAGCAAFGLPVPDVLRAVSAGEHAALWLGPDEVLLLAPAGKAAPPGGAVVTISDRQIGMSLDGPDGEAMLAAGCPLDLTHFEVGSCTRTVLGKAEIVLWRTAPATWRIEVWRSFAAYVQALLRQAGRDWT